ncbi:DivIVA domain-containing protein [Streptomyces sp. NPDC058471]|uniref:DivIVA domain-containing protein n=1 Tax=Streptomyces sp. NPDC058471 TaxID=3346516 RepID=UPI0036656B00
MITPADINRKQFTVTRIRGGYDQDEVDNFLDRVEVDYTALLNDRAHVVMEVEALRNRPTSPPDAVTAVVPPTPSASAERLLGAAQRTADQVVEEARVEAEKVLAAARGEAEAVKLAAEAERRKVLDQLGGECAELEEKVDALRTKRTTYKSWLKAALTKLEEEEGNDA